MWQEFANRSISCWCWESTSVSPKKAPGKKKPEMRDFLKLKWKWNKIRVEKRGVKPLYYITAAQWWNTLCIGFVIGRDGTSFIIANDA